MIKFKTILVEKKDPHLIQKIVDQFMNNPEDFDLSTKKSKVLDYFTVDRSKRGVITIYKTYWVDGKRNLKTVESEWKLPDGKYAQIFQQQGIDVEIQDSGINPDHVWVELYFSQAEAPEEQDIDQDFGDEAESDDEVGYDQDNEQEDDTEDDMNAGPAEESKAVAPVTKNQLVNTFANMIVKGEAKNKFDAIQKYLRRFGRRKEDIAAIQQIGDGEIGKAVRMKMMGESKIQEEVEITPTLQTIYDEWRKVLKANPSYTEIGSIIDRLVKDGKISQEDVDAMGTAEQIGYKLEKMLKMKQRENQQKREASLL